MGQWLGLKIKKRKTDLSSPGQMVSGAEQGLASDRESWFEIDLWVWTCRDWKVCDTKRWNVNDYVLRYFGDESPNMSLSYSRNSHLESIFVRATRLCLCKAVPGCFNVVHKTWKNRPLLPENRLEEMQLDIMADKVNRPQHTEHIPAFVLNSLMFCYHTFPTLILCTFV